MRAACGLWMGVLAGLAVAGCGDPRGGASGSRRVGGCEAFTACGGDVTGEWEQEWSCLDSAPQVDVSFFAGYPECQGVTRFDGVEREGTVTFRPDGTVSDSSTAAYHTNATVGAACLQAIGIGPASAASCAELATAAADASFSGGTCEPRGSSCECAFYYVNPAMLWNGWTYQSSGGSLQLGPSATFELCAQSGEMTLRAPAAGSTLSLRFRRVAD